MKFTLGAKLGLGFGAVLTLMLVSSGLSYLKLQDIKESAGRMSNVSVPSLDYYRQTQNYLNYSGSKARHAILAGTEPDRREVAMKAYNGAYDNIAKDVDALDKLSSRWKSQEDRDRFARLKESLPAARAAQEAAIDLATSGVPDAVVKGGNEYADKATPVVDQTTKTLGDLADSSEELVHADAVSLIAANTSMAWTMLLTTLAAMAVGLSSLFS